MLHLKCRLLQHIMLPMPYKNEGVKVTVSQNPQSGTVYVTGNGKEAESSNVDYARETVNQINARHLLAANIAALKTYQDMYKSVIDIRA
jgi:flagellar hook protein FlgE